MRIAWDEITFRGATQLASLRMPLAFLIAENARSHGRLRAVIPCAGGGIAAMFLLSMRRPHTGVDLSQPMALYNDKADFVKGETRVSE